MKLKRLNKTQQFFTILMILPIFIEIFNLPISILSSFFLLGIIWYLLCFLGLVSSIGFTISIKSKWYYKIIPMPLYLIGLYLSFHLAFLGHFTYLIINSRNLNSIVNHISESNIYSMSDLYRYSKNINECNVSTDKPITSIDELIKTFSPCLDTNRIKPLDVICIRNLMSSCHLIQFVSNNDYILFTIDGFIDNCFGIVYSKNGSDPNIKNDKSIDELTSLNRIWNNWFFWTST